MWKGLLCAAIFACANCGVWAASGNAESYPNKPIRVIDSFPPGGSSDYMARVIGAKLTERFGQPVIVDNRAGASGNLGAEIVARANPDGYTLFLAVSAGLASSPSLYRKLGYDVLKDFSYISRVATGPQILLVHPSVPAKSLAELAAFARSNPKALRYGSGSVGSLGHLTTEMLLSRIAVKILHVPYKGAGPLFVALSGGEVQLGFTSVAAIPLVQAKRLNAVAISGAKRLAVLPQVPTVAESGYPGFNATNTFGMLAPAGTPAAIVKLLNAEIRYIVQNDDIKAKFTAQGLEAGASTPAEYKAIIKAEMTQWARVIKDAQITAN